MMYCYYAELDKMEEQGYANRGKGKQQVSHKSVSKLHANKFWQKNRSFAGTTVSAKSLFAPLRLDNVAEVQFFWLLYEQLHPKSSKDFSAMAEQWNTITTMQLHTGNSQFKFVKLKRGSHLSKFWHSEGHKHLQRDASNIAALIQGVSQMSVLSDPQWLLLLPHLHLPPLSLLQLVPLQHLLLLPNLQLPSFPTLAPPFHLCPLQAPLCSLLRKDQEQSRGIRLATKTVNADPIMHMLGCKHATQPVGWWIPARFLRSARKVSSSTTHVAMVLLSSKCGQSPSMTTHHLHLSLLAGHRFTKVCMMLIPSCQGDSRFWKDCWQSRHFHEG